MNKLLFLLLCSAQLVAKDFYVIEGASDTSELFSTFNTALGLLDQYDRGELKGFEVAFNKNGKYYEKSKGANWWEYYFEPLKLGSTASPPLKLPNYKKRILSLTSQFEMGKERAHTLFSKYIKIKPSLLKKADSFFPENIPILGVYYHKSKEEAQPPLSYETVFTAIQNQLDMMPSTTQLFLVTPDERFEEFLKTRFPLLLYKNRGSKGEKELIQALLLSKTEVLVRTSNTFSLSVSQINPNLLTVNLDKNWQEFK